jgi:hypothetical protein
MSGLPILGTSESSIDTDRQERLPMTVDVNSKIFNSYNTNIPDFSEVVTGSDSDRRYHCISTKTNSPPMMSSRVENDAIDTIIRKLNDDKSSKQIKVIDDTDNDNDRDTVSYVTNSKFSSVLSDMSLDLLSMVNLVRGLNSKIVEQGSERQNVHSDVCGLIEENKRLRESLSKMKVENDRRYDALCKQYDTKFESFAKLIENKDYGRFNANTSNGRLDYHEGMNKPKVRKSKTDVVVSAPLLNMNVVKLEEVDEPIDDSTQIHVDDNVDDNVEDLVDDTENNQEKSLSMIVDRQLEKRLPKSRPSVVTKRPGGQDIFGDVKLQQNGPVINVATRQRVRTDIADGAIKKMTDSNTIRSNRMKLPGSVSLGNKASIQRM